MDTQKLAKRILIGENETALELISREIAELSIPLQDCSGRNYNKDEREDIVRYFILGAETQRDKDFETMLRRYDSAEFEKLKKKYEFE